MKLSRIPQVLLFASFLLFAGLACGSESPTALPTPDSAASGDPTTVHVAAPTEEAPPTATSTPIPTTEPTPTPVRTATVPAQTSTPRPEGGPSAPLPTEVPLLGSVLVPRDHPAAPLAMLPENSLIYTHINIGSTSQRPDVQEHVEFQLAHFVSEEELPFAEELLASTGVRTVTLSIPHEGYEWAGIIQGDLLAVASALGSSPEFGAGLSISVIQPIAGEDIYALVRTRSSGRQSELYMAIIDDDYLAVSPHFAAVLDVIARSRNPLQLPHALSAMIEEWGLGDLLQVLNIPFFGIGATMQGTPLDRQRLFAYHATLSEGSSTVFRALQQYDDEAQALAATAWLHEQDEPRWRDVGWGSSVSVEQWQQRGATTYGEVTVPDADVPSLVQGN